MRMRVTTISLPVEIWDAVSNEAKDTGWSKSEIIRIALMNYFKMEVEG